MKKLSKIDAGIVILILPAISYGMAYLFIRGHIKYYKLPGMFIDLNVNTITPILFVFFLLSLIVFVLWGSIFSLLKIVPIKIKKLFRMRPSVTPLEKSLDFIFSLFFFVFLVFLLIEGIEDLGKFDASLEKEFMVIKQKEHQEEKLFVGVTFYKDSIIIAPLNLEKESITPKFKAIELKELKDAEMVHFENGLKIEDIKNSKDLTE